MPSYLSRFGSYAAGAQQTTYTTFFSSLHHLSCSALLSSFSSLIYTLLLLDTPKLYSSACPSSPTHPLALGFALTDRLLTKPIHCLRTSIFPYRKELSQYVVRKLSSSPPLLPPILALFVASHRASTDSSLRPSHVRMGDGYLEATMKNKNKLVVNGQGGPIGQNRNR